MRVRAIAKGAPIDRDRGEHVGKGVHQIRRVRSNISVSGLPKLEEEGTMTWACGRDSQLAPLSSPLTARTDPRGQFRCARKRDGSVWCWGMSPDGGKIGRDDNVVEPTQVAGIDSTIDIAAETVHVR